MCIRDRICPLHLLVNQQVERANQSKSRFLAAVSHDLTQPLNAAKLFTSSLLEMLPPEDEPARICLLYTSRFITVSAATPSTIARSSRENR